MGVRTGRESRARGRGRGRGRWLGGRACGLGVPRKAVTMCSLQSPTASKINAPWYDESSEMPISEGILSSPAPSAVCTCGGRRMRG